MNIYEINDIIIDGKIKVYAIIDSNNTIKRIESDISSTYIDFTDGKWIEIDEGYGDKFAHAQNEYLDGSIYDMLGRPNYKYVDGEIIKLSDKDKLLLFPDNSNDASINTTEDKEKASIMEGIIDLSNQVETLKSGASSEEIASIMEAIIDLSAQVNSIKSTLKEV